MTMTSTCSRSPPQRSNRRVSKISHLIRLTWPKVAISWSSSSHLSVRWVLCHSASTNTSTRQMSMRARLVSVVWRATDSKMTSAWPACALGFKAAVTTSNMPSISSSAKTDTSGPWFSSVLCHLSPVFWPWFAVFVTKAMESKASQISVKKLISRSQRRSNIASLESVLTSSDWALSITREKSKKPTEASRWVMLKWATKTRSLEIHPPASRESTLRHLSWQIAI